MKFILLGGKRGQGKFALVDDEDYEWASRHKWYLTNPGGYVAGYVASAQRLMRIHREILQASDDMQVDHINGDRLDNRRCNLRVCTHSQNFFNKGKMPGKSGYKGVYNFGKRWKVMIQADRKQHYIGYFSSEIDAAKAYDEAAKKYHGEFARLNFPE